MVYKVQLKNAFLTYRFSLRGSFPTFLLNRKILPFQSRDKSIVLLFFTENILYMLLFCNKVDTPIPLHCEFQHFLYKGYDTTVENVLTAGKSMNSIMKHFDWMGQLYKSAVSEIIRIIYNLFP